MPIRHRSRVLSVLSAVAGASTLTLAVSATGVLAVAHPARAHRRAPAAHCSKVRGHRVLATTKVRVFSQPFHRVFTAGNTQMVGRNFLGCVLPRGRAFKLVQSYEEYSYPEKIKGQTPLDSGGVWLHQSVGDFLEVEDQQSNLTGDYHEVRLRVFDLATGHSYVYGHSLDSPNGTSHKDAPLPSRVLLNDRGQLAGVYTNPAGSGPKDFPDPPPGSTEIVAFNAQGTRTILDSAPSVQIPAASLSLNGSTVSWTHAGQAKTATIG